MDKKTRAESALARRMGDEESCDYPDFEAMWARIEAAKHQPEAEFDRGRQARAVRPRGRRLALFATAAFVMLATPVLASMAGQWDFSFRPGVESALNHGFGQTIGQSIRNGGVTFTIDSAMADDNGTTLLYSFDPGDKEPREWRFSGVELRKADGEAVMKIDDLQTIGMKLSEGYYSHAWDKENNRYNGFLETNWTFDGKETELQLIVRGLQQYDGHQATLALDLSETGVQTFPIRAGGIETANIQILREEGGQAVLKSFFTYTDERTANNDPPKIQVKKDGKLIKRSGIRVDRLREQWTGKEIYQWDDIRQPGVTFELAYMTPGRKVDGEWTFGTLRLNKEKALQASATRELDLPFRTTDGDAAVRKLFIRPTGIRLEIEHRREFGWLPYKRVYLSVAGRQLEGEWRAIDPGNQPSSPYRQTYLFEAPPDLLLTPDMPMELLLQDEREEKWFYEQPVRLPDISDEKRTLTTDVGGYTVNWTYYKRNGKLYIESESPDDRFGGINQTFYYQGEQRIPGQTIYDYIEAPGAAHDGNKRVECYPGFEGADAELYIYMYYVNHPERKLTVKLQ
ncbi:DUF4179 domain-containing protein [Paenibacillus sp. GCM10027626]|uniref:DUF4179 domain-containing protein n=1 Tax=Paenibacillus sp. GCM10027626 TaxID=3273411 RepID=UPI0036427765